MQNLTLVDSLDILCLGTIKVKTNCRQWTNYHLQYPSVLRQLWSELWCLRFRKLFHCPQFFTRWYNMSKYYLTRAASLMSPGTGESWPICRTPRDEELVQDDGHVGSMIMLTVVSRVQERLQWRRDHISPWQWNCSMKVTQVSSVLEEQVLVFPQVRHNQQRHLPSN